MMEYKINLKNEGQSWSLRFEHTVWQPNSMVFNKETRQWEDEKERVRISLIAEKKGKTPAFNQSISVASVSYIPGNKPEMIRMLTDEDASDIIDELINKGYARQIKEFTEKITDYPGSNDVDEFKYRRLDVTAFYNEYMKEQKEMLKNSPFSDIHQYTGELFNGKRPSDYMVCDLYGVPQNKVFVGIEGREKFNAVRICPEAVIHLHELAQDKYAEKLELYKEAMQRVTSLTTYEARNEFFMRCKIDGVQQMAVNVSRKDIQDYLVHKNGYGLAAKYYADELKSGMSREYSLRR